jgi:seryl-tRNA synthetase
VPYIVNSDSLKGTGQLPKFEGDLFAAKKGGQDAEPVPDTAALYLIPTAEVPLTNLVRDEVLAEELPIKLTAHSPASARKPARTAATRAADPPAPVRQGRDGADRAPRQELRSAGRDDGPRRAVLQKLGLPYRVMSLCTGDMGFGAAKTYDLEVWVPAQNTYREISSVSNCEAFQARRMQALQECPGQERTGAHAQRLRPGRGPYAGRRAGELPERRRLDHRARSTGFVHGWQNFAEGLIFRLQ